MGDHRTRKFRVLGQECTHQQAAIAPPLHRQPCRAGVTTLDQVPGTSREVVEDKVKIMDFNASIAYALGLPLDQVIYSPSKRPFTIADKGQPITNLFA